MFPTMIAMKGLSTNKKSEIARKLAAHLQYPLIDETDIIPFVEPDGANFEIITRVTSTQLDSKLNVIINTPLYKHDDFVQLVELASSKSSSLIIIECLSTRDSDEDSDGDVYDIGKVPCLIIDMEEAFKVEEFAPKLLQMSTSHEAFEEKESEGSTSTSILSFDEKIRSQWHAHEFSMVSDANIANFEKLHCNNCKRSISGATYKCLECDEFILHKECAEFKDKCPWYLRQNNPEYQFPSKHKCNICDNFSISCPNCLFQTHIESGFCPTILRYEGHEHPLSFVIMPPWVNFIYKCSKCDQLGNSISYKCYNCCFDLHLHCALPLHDQYPEKVLIYHSRGADVFPEFQEESRAWLSINEDDLKYALYHFQSLTAIKSLFIAFYDGVETLPEWLGNLSSLKSLLIWNCKNLKHLPSARALQGLSQMAQLIIDDCPLLIRSCAKENGSEWSKISHIPVICIGRDYLQGSQGELDKSWLP